MRDRIVSVTTIDLIGLYGTIMKLAGTSFTGINATNPGEFELTSGSGNFLASEPVKSFDLDSSVTAVVYFVPAYDYVGFSIGGTPATTSGDVDPDGRTLYSAAYSGGTVAITKVGF